MPLAILTLVAECAKLGEQYVIWRSVLRVRFEHGALEVLHAVGLAIQIARFRELVGDGIALLGEAAVLLPVGQECATYTLACFGEEDEPAALLGCCPGAPAGYFWL